MSPSPAAHDINLAWLLRLRWYLFAVQAAVVAWMAQGLEMHLQVGWLLGVLALGLGSNLGLRLLRPRATERLLLGVMLADTLLWTVHLYFTGGPFNPFSAMYLVGVALGVLVLGRAFSWVLSLASLAAFGSLFWLQGREPPEGLRLPSHAELMKLHLAGMLLAFAVAAAFIVYFLQRVQGAMREQEAELARARQVAARHQQLAALTTLAAGAAHELSTPLGTIAVVARELERAVARMPASPEVVEDLALIRAQVERCRGILGAMSLQAGAPSGEVLQPVSVAEWLTRAASRVSSPSRVVVDAPEPSLRVLGPRTALAQAVQNLVENGLSASTAPVRVSARAEGAQVLVTVADAGHGMPPAVLARLGEPFFTTRETGAGLGLGVFLARTLAEHLGGRLDFTSRPGEGTTACLRLPAAPLESP